MLSLDSIFSNSSDIALCAFRSHGFSLSGSVPVHLRFGNPAVRYFMELTFDYTVTLFSHLARSISESCLLRLLLTSHSSLLLRLMRPTVCEISRDKPTSLSSSTCLIYTHGLRLPFGLRFGFVSARLSSIYALYQVSVHQTTISLSLLLACTLGVILGIRYGVRRQLRPSWTYTTD